LDSRRSDDRGVVSCVSSQFYPSISTDISRVSGGDNKPLDDSST
jgi:hypothetical protein